MRPLSSLAGESRFLWSWRRGPGGVAAEGQELASEAQVEMWEGLGLPQGTRSCRRGL